MLIRSLRWRLQLWYGVLLMVVGVVVLATYTKLRAI